MEPTIGLFKTEVIEHERATWTSWRHVEQATASWVHWYNHERLHSATGHLAPVEFEDLDYALAHDVEHPLAAEHSPPKIPGRFTPRVRGQTEGGPPVLTIRLSFT